MRKKKTIIWGVIAVVAVLLIVWGVDAAGNNQQEPVINRSVKTEAVKQTANTSDYAQAEKIYNLFKTNNGLHNIDDQTTTFTVMENGNNFKFYSENRPDGFYVLQRIDRFNSKDDKYSYELIPVDGGTPMGIDSEDIVACYNNLRASDFSRTLTH